MEGNSKNTVDIPKSRNYTDDDLEEVVVMNRPPMESVKDVAAPKPRITDPIDVEKGVKLYKKLYENKSVAVPSFDYEVGDALTCARQMMLTTHVSRAPDHIGEPVEKPPFEHEKEISLLVCVPLDEQYGKRCNVTISTGHPCKRRQLLQLSETVRTSEKEMYLELELNHLVNKCRRFNPPCLQFIIQGAYLSTETDEEAELKPGPYFCKRIEVWSKDFGYNLSAPVLVKCWAQNSVEVMNAVHDPLLYTLLFDPPNCWMAESSSRFKSLVEIEVSVYPMDTEPPDDVIYDYNTNPMASRIYESYADQNEKISKEVKKSWGLRMEETEKVMKCTNITYEPKCGKRTYMDIECIVCGKKFMSLPELLAHIYMFYPKMAVALQRFGEGECRLILSFTDLDITTLGRTDFQFFRGPNANKKFDFIEIMLKALSVSDIFDDQGQYEKNMYETYNKALLNGIMCHLCRMSPIDYTNYIHQRRKLWKIGKQLFNPSYKCFHFMLTSFLAKRHAYGLETLNGYMTCRVFIHCHHILVENDVFNFQFHFGNFLEYDYQTILKCKAFENQLMADIGLRARNANYTLVSEAGHWFFKALWAEDYSKEGPEHEFIRNLIKGPFPETNAQRKEVVKQILSDRVSAKETCMNQMADKMKDSYGQEFFIPKCMYFGAVANEEDQRMLKTFYKN